MNTQGIFKEYVRYIRLQMVYIRVFGGGQLHFLENVRVPTSTFEEMWMTPSFSLQMGRTSYLYISCLFSLYLAKYYIYIQRERETVIENMLTLHFLNKWRQLPLLEEWVMAISTLEEMWMDTSLSLSFQKGTTSFFYYVCSSCSRPHIMCI